MKKMLRFWLLAALMVPLGANATIDTLTVAAGDSTNAAVTNGYIPIYGLWADAAQHNQIIYPASMLTDMIGQNIVGMNFYVTGDWSTSVATISLAVIPDSVLTALRTGDTLLEVYSGAWTSTTELAFSAGFTYTGGHLLVDIQTVAGSYSSSSATGIARDGASFYSYSSTTGVQNFLPKVSFIYSDQTLCSAPSAPTLNITSTTSLSISWTAGGSESEWQIMVGDSLISNVTDTTYTINDLSPSTYHNVKVRAICGIDDTSSWSRAIPMATECAAINGLPYIVDFESDISSVPYCWTVVRPIIFTDYNGNNVSSPYLEDYSSYAHSGNNSLYFVHSTYNGSVQDTAVIATPAIDHDADDLHVTFWFYPRTFPTTAYSSFQAGVITDTADASTFIPILTITPFDINGNYSYRQCEFYTNNEPSLATADNVHVAFRAIANGSNIYLYVDDLVIEPIGNCLPIVLNSGSVDSISYNAVQLSYQLNDPSSDVVVRLTSQTGAVTYHSVSADTTILIEGLDDNTAYMAEGAVLCGDDTTLFVHIADFTTHLRCYDVQNAACVALTANAAALAWSHTGTGIEPASVEITLYNLTDTNIAPEQVSVVGSTNHTFTGLIEGNVYRADLYVICGDDDTSSIVSVTFMPSNPPCAEIAGDVSDSYVPFYSYYNNGFSESLYEATLIDGIDTITGLSLDVVSTLHRDNIVDIYMGYTSLSAISANSWVPVSELTHVVSDYSLNTARAGWTDVIPFDTVFVTQPHGDSLNLIIAFYNHTGSFNSGLTWGTHVSPVGTSCYRYTDNPIDITSPYGSYTTSTTPNAPNLQFYGNCGGGDCTAPSVTVSAVDTTTATLTWLPGGSESSWVIEYRLIGSPTWTSGGTAIAQPHTLTGLNPGSVYQIRLGSDCGDTVVFSTATTCNTLCGRVPAPINIVPMGDNNCWTFIGGSYSSYGAYYYINNGASIISPILADSINTLQLKVNGFGSDFYVGVCDANGANPVWIDTITFLTNNSNEPSVHKVYFDNYTGTQDHIIIKATGNYSYFYNIAIEPLDACMYVRDVAVDSATTTELWLSWNSDGNNFEVMYHAESDTTGTWTTATSTTNSIHMTGLTHSEYYQVKIFNICSANSRSDSTFLRVQTVCAPKSTPYAEYFAGTELPVCWNVQEAPGNGTTFATTARYSNPYVYSDATSTTTPYDDWIMTPEIQLPANADNYILLYYAGGNPSTSYTGSTASYEVYVSTTGNGSVANYTTLVHADSAMNTGNYLYPERLSLAAYGGQTVSFAFRNTSTVYGRILLGNIEVREAVEPLYYIDGNNRVYTRDTNVYVAVHQEGILEGMTRTWTSSMAAAGLATMTGSTTDTMSIIYTAAGVDTITFIATNAYGADTITGLVYVYDCDPISQFPYSESFETESAPAGCWEMVYGNGDPSVNPMTHTNDIGSYLPAGSIPDGTRAFRFSSFSSISGNNYNQYLISPEFNGSNMTLGFKYAKYNSDTTERIRVGYSSTNRDTNSFTWSPWITDLDYNSWTQFNAAMPEGTKFFAIQYYGSYAYYVYIDDVVVTGTGLACDVVPTVALDTVGENDATITIGGDSAASYQVAIIEGTWIADSVTPVATTDTTYTFNGLTAATEYTVGVRAVCAGGLTSDWVTTTLTTAEHPCFVPTNVTTSLVTFDGVTVGWTPGENETSWEVNVTGPSYDQTFATTTNPYDVTGLNAGETYTVKVRAICSETQQSDWSEPAQFTTERCQPVSGVAANATEPTTATVTWNPASNGNGNYEVEYGMTGFRQGNGTRVTVNGATTYTLTGLDENSSYDVYVRTFCDATLTSEWSSVVTFTTPEEVGIDNVEGSDIALYPNPARTTVTINGLESGSTVTVVDLNGRVVLTSTDATLDVSDLAQGAYFVRIVGERQNAIRKLIVK